MNDLQLSEEGYKFLTCQRVVATLAADKFEAKQKAGYYGWDNPEQFSFFLDQANAHLERIKGSQKGDEAKAKDCLLDVINFATMMYLLLEQKEEVSHDNT